MDRQEKQELALWVKALDRVRTENFGSMTMMEELNLKEFCVDWLADLAVGPRSELSELVGDAVGEVESLKEEIEEWRDNLDNANMTHLPKYDEVSEAADALETAQSQAEDAQSEFDNLPDDVKTSVTPYRYGKTKSRSSRAGEAGAMLRVVADRLRELEEAKTERLDQIAKATSADDLSKTDSDALEAEQAKLEEADYETAAESLGQAADELDNVSFPGMY